MGWSWRIAVVAGIPINVHGTFAVLIIFLLISGLAEGRGLAAAVSSVVFILAIFVTIILHELGHALTARRFGIRTRDITLLPIGGLARLERMPDVPRQELWVALAGPAVNLAIAVVAYGAYLAATGVAPELKLAPASTGVVGRFAAINVTLAVFNMVPAFPMDGGRALRALLAERVDYARATNPLLVFIALFVWMGASAEATAIGMRTALNGVPVSRAMITDFRTVRAESSLGEALELMVHGSQMGFPVLGGPDDALVGILTRDQLLAALSREGPLGTVGDVMATHYETADPLTCSIGHVSGSRAGRVPWCRYSRMAVSSVS